MSSLPADLTSEILLKLPARSVARFRCVSKLWSSITTDSYFIKSFETRFLTLQPSLLVCFKEDDQLFVAWIPQQHDQNSKEFSSSNSKPIYRYHMKFPEYGFLPPTESVHGLICFQESGTPTVWSPSKREFLTLSKPIVDRTVFLGYDPVEGTHKVMCIPFKRGCLVCWVLTLGSSAKESWRMVKTNIKHRSVGIHTSGRCIKGVIYYEAYIYETHDWAIMSFDVRSEFFCRIDLPFPFIRYIMIKYEYRLINYKGRLACVVMQTSSTNKLWILEDAEKHKWSRTNISIPSGYTDESLGIHFEFKGFTHAREFIYVPSTFNKSYHVVFRDPVKGSFRRFEFKDIADDESRPSKGVNNGYTYRLHTFPSYI